ncbi:succinate dehydrogenase/fumarate reductase, flavoprotein subunit [Anoxybacillus sp. B7M1]|jgi:succinate dehydrogenase / fumarate reductase, flavoprotein subunit|uniref:succinate dehydrogenase n=1 Tax=Anoxybacteroides rupiense TaxID=311460 RepID=A0ABD5IT79_9BACL|nr:MULTISPECIES: succinate dehydrogenase flavoprotein subunit [Anoxybacillus]ANB55810.1 succinate dehydrogenase/fumarate reductase, flavoprotein subunit [Anoxybacillus sp. B2M1]ANB64935.1 succinate dehydrogenase/fumarate reductase, flavoprotein subunit [Anoxybacillus sp. B7M1]KXG11527.1 Fumarate reductase flavoprotein subunit [Anoxybacillus sp. P3H1B]MED5051073.1 succinate dehydrogenase flavoprotein subunit [Anoxybacillus rupiensis]OQM45667.1 succinate dehydrogenase flavoprotein subunit [Anoxy
MKKGKIIVVGGGLAGLMATIKIAEAGVPVELFSLVPVKRSHSVCAQGGINGAVNTKGEGDSPWEHFDDTVYGGDFLANQPPVKAMCEAAPGIIYLLDRMGVMFNRTPEGLLDFRRFGGTQHHRTAFAGATTGQQLLYALDEQVRRHEVAGLVTKYEGWEFLGAVLDDEQICRGIVAQNLTTMEIQSFAADAVIMATGGPGIIFGKSTNSIINTGSAASIVYQQGAYYANGEFIQIHPTAIPGDDKLRLMSESARGEGGRVWTYKDGKPWYFLEEKYPAYGNLVPRDIATREIFHVCVDLKLGINGENMVYLDLSHKDPKELDIKLGGIIEIYEKFMGEDPRKVPMKIFPAVHYSMGGLWVDYDQMTNIKGLFAAGECDYSMHGANRLGANSLLSAIYGGMVAGPKAVEYIKGLDKSSDALPSSLYERYVKQEEERWNNILSMNGTENAYVLHKELGEWMTDNVTIVRYNDKLLRTDEKIQELMERYKNINISDTAKWSNQAASFTRQLHNMLQLARVITLGAYNRNESRGAHYKPEFPERNDEEWLKTTMARFTPDGPAFHYEDVDTSLIKPRKRDYSKKKEDVKS